MKDAAPPSAAHLPVEPARPFPVDALKEAAKRRGGSLNPYQMSSSDYDIAFITPVLAMARSISRRRRADASVAGGQRLPDEEESLVRPLMEFGSWTEYLADFPPVLLVRVTPKAGGGFLEGRPRAAPRMTQGVSLPPIKRFKSGFSRMRAFCGDAEVTPIHPFKLQQRISESDAIYEGLYVFDPGALGAAVRDRQARAVFGEGARERGQPGRRSEGAPSRSGRTSNRIELCCSPAIPALQADHQKVRRNPNRNSRDRPTA